MKSYRAGIDIGSTTVIRFTDKMFHFISERLSKNKKQ